MPPAIHPQPGTKLIASIAASMTFEDITLLSWKTSYPTAPNDITPEAFPIALKLFGITCLYILLLLPILMPNVFFKARPVSYTILLFLLVGILSYPYSVNKLSPKLPESYKSPNQNDFSCL